MRMVPGPRISWRPCRDCTKPTASVVSQLGTRALQRSSDTCNPRAGAVPSITGASLSYRSGGSFIYAHLHTRSRCGIGISSCTSVGSEKYQGDWSGTTTSSKCQGARSNVNHPPPSLFSQDLKGKFILLIET